MALFKFTKNILDDKPIQVFNNGKHVRDFTYVDDIVNGIYACIDYDFSKNLNQMLRTHRRNKYAPLGI